MKLIPALAVAGIIALGTTGSVALTASHQTPAPVAYVAWHEPEPTPVAVPVPSDNIAPDKSYSGYQGASQPTCQEDEPCWDCRTMGNLICGTVAAPEAAEPPVAVAPVYVTGAPVVTGTVQVKQAPVAKPTPVKTPVAVPTVKPTPSPVATTCPPLIHRDGVNITPPNAPAYCVYAQ